jgi:DNA-3-methyladenine glycosylase II
MLDYAHARRHLARRDPVMRDLMRRHGPCGLPSRQHADPFKALMQAIMSQQLSTKAAATIGARVMALCGDDGPTAEAVERLSDEQLRAAGLSGQKTRYMRDLSARVLDGSLALTEIESLEDEDVIGALTSVKGIGRWTAEMFLIFRLQRPDVLPVGDLGIVKAVQRNYGMRRVPSPTRLVKLGERWRPYRSVACWYLWASLNNTPTRE